MTRLSTPTLIALLALALLSACSSTSDGMPDAATDDAAFFFDDDSGTGPDAAVPDAGQHEDASQDAGLTPLVIQSVSPSRGSIAGGATLVLTGTGFFKSFASGATAAQPETSVFVGKDQVTNLVLINDLRIEATVPPAIDGQPGVVDVVLQNPSGMARCEGCFTYYEPLAIDVLTPTQGSTTGGEWVELEGRGFGDALWVLFGEAPSHQVEISGAGSARAMTPPMSQAGPILVRVFNKNGLVEWVDGFTYEAPLSLESIEPRAVPLSGAIEVTLSGSALDRISKLYVDGQPLPFLLTHPEELRFTAPQRSAPGSATLMVETPDGIQTSLDGGLIYFDPDFAPSQEDGTAFQIVGLCPTHGPAQGGTAVHIFGSHLDQISQIWMDGLPIATDALARVSQQELILTVPTGQANHWATLRFEDMNAQDILLERAYRYDLRLTGVSPSHGPSTGGEWILLDGAGFDEGTHFAVRFDGMPLDMARDIVRLSNTELWVKAPAGKGSADIAVFEAADPTNSDVLPDAFTFDEPLSIAAVSPASGSLAGGDDVSIYGTGFEPGLTVLFGNSFLRDVAILGSNHLVGRVPTGSAGSVDVSVQLGTSRDTLAGGYTYRDASANVGGSSGSVLTGTLNVTVFLTTATRIADVHITASTDGGSSLLASGRTDADGRLTLQSPGFNRPLRVTFEKEGFQTLVVENQSSSNLSVFLTQVSSSASTGSGNSSSGSSEADPSAIPGGSTAAGGSTSSPDYSLGSLTPVMSGVVTGFKLPRELGPTEIAMAEVWTLPTSYYSTPPFGSTATPYYRDMAGERWRVTSDGGPFTIYGSSGRQSLYALFGIYDTQTQVLTPYLMGLLRNVAVSAGTPAVNLEIRLDMHLDQVLPITILPEPAALDLEDEAEAGRLLTYSTYAWLTLGNEGYIAFGPVSGTSSSLEMQSLPRLDASNFLFLNQSLSADGKFSSFCFQRSSGALNNGITVGPMLGRLIPITHSTDDNGVAPGMDAVFDGTIRWRFESGSAPDLLHLYVTISHANGTDDRLEVILPGASTEFSLPASLALSIDPEADSISVSYQASRAPRFGYDFWSYTHFSTASLSCWASGSFQIPLHEEETPGE